MVRISHRGIGLLIAVAATILNAAHFDKLTPAQQNALAGAANDCSTAAASEAERADACNAILTTAPYADVSNVDLGALKGLMLDFEKCVKSKILQKVRAPAAKGFVASTPARKRESRQAKVGRKASSGSVVPSETVNLPTLAAATDDILHGPPDFWQLSVKLTTFACTQTFLEGSVVTAQYCDMVLSQQKASVPDKQQRNTACDTALAKIPEVLQEVMRKFPWRSWQVDAKAQAVLPGLAPKSPASQQSQPKSTLPQAQAQPLAATPRESSAPVPADSVGNNKQPVGKTQPQEELPQPVGSATPKQPNRPNTPAPISRGNKDSSTESQPTVATSKSPQTKANPVAQPDAKIPPPQAKANPDNQPDGTLPHVGGPSQPSLKPNFVTAESKHKPATPDRPAPRDPANPPTEPAPSTPANETPTQGPLQRQPVQPKSPNLQPEVKPTPPSLPSPVQQPQSNSKDVAPAGQPEAKPTVAENKEAEDADSNPSSNQEDSEHEQQDEVQPQPVKQSNRPIPQASANDLRKDTTVTPQLEPDHKTPQGQTSPKTQPADSATTVPARPIGKPNSAVSEAPDKHKQVVLVEPPQPQASIPQAEQVPPASANDTLPQQGPTAPSKHRPPGKPVQQPQQQNYTAAPAENGAPQLNETFTEEETAIRAIVKDAVMKKCTLTLIEAVIKKYYCDSVYAWVSGSVFLAAAPLLLAIDTFLPGTYNYFLHVVRAVFCIREEIKTGLDELKQNFTDSKKPTPETDKMIRQLKINMTDDGVSLGSMLSRWTPPSVNLTRVLKAMDDLGIGGRDGLGGFIDLVSMIPVINNIPGINYIMDLASGYSDNAPETNDTSAKNDTKSGWAKKYGSKFVKAGVWVANAKNKGCDLMWKPIQKAGKKVWDLKVSDVWDRVKESRAAQKVQDKVNRGSTKATAKWQRLKAHVKRVYGRKYSSGAEEPNRAQPPDFATDPNRAQPPALAVESNRAQPPAFAADPNRAKPSAFRAAELNRAPEPSTVRTESNRGEPQNRTP